MTAPDLVQLRGEIQRNVGRHSARSDSIYHNGGTVLALAATAAATIIPSEHFIWAKVCAAVATFIIAVTRALDFGGRWRFHIEMQASYVALLDRLDEIDFLPESERLAAIKRIFDTLERLRAREGGIPGAGAPTVGPQ
jgi:hypothetical protein